jgi:hypothetical protein
MLSALAGCETKVDLDVNEGPKNIVVDGGITDSPGNDTIFLSQTQDYNSSSDFTYIGGATLVVTEDGTLKDTLLEVDQGVYVTQLISQGKIGSTYQLYLRTAEGVEYESTVETIQPIIPIDSLYFRKSDELDFAPFLEEGYYGQLAFQDPENEDNYNDYKYYINGEFQNNPEDIDLYDDKYINGQYVDDFFIDFPLEVGDTLRVQQIAVTQGRYDYMVNLKQLLTANGGPFDPPIPPVIGNVFKKGSTTEYALGYFQATASISIKEFVVQR